jgi:leader peptidase (prepilin peptidase) / N-methyltransferase
VPIALYAYIFAGFAFVLGAVVGSFLNVCIYRMPLGLSVNEPKRSFCPLCKWQIPFYHNIPLVSWLALRGRCANCGGRIPFLYFGVELLTALLFFAVWMHLAWPVLGPDVLLALPYWILTALFIVATFIDFDHFIIPDEITIGGTVAGLALSFALPQMMGVETRLTALGWSAAGAAGGFFLLWGVVIAGKAAFGKKRIMFDEKPAPFTWRREGETATLTTDGEAEQWLEFFPDEKAVMRMKCARLEIGGKRFEEIEITSRYETLTVEGRDHDLNELEEFSGEFREVFFERDAMGFGDVKFIACIGAFLGWKAVVFTVMSASVLGSIVGVTAIVLRRREWSAKIPFGPYLAAGAMLWMFFGPALLAWYMGLMRPAEF